MLAESMSIMSSSVADVSGCAAAGGFGVVAGACGSCRCNFGCPKKSWTHKRLAGGSIRAWIRAPSTGGSKVDGVDNIDEVIMHDLRPAHDDKVAELRSVCMTWLLPVGGCPTSHPIPYHVDLRPRYILTVYYVPG
jgi:hypothetical protein